MLAAVCFWGATAATAGEPKHAESWYTKALAEVLAARSEVALKNGTRCDVFATHFVIEVEFAPKWVDGIGRALSSGSQTGRRGAIALILESDSDERFLKRLREVISWHQLPIAVIVLRPFHETGLTLEFPEGILPPAGRRLKHAGARALPDFMTPVEAMDFLSQTNKWDRSASRPYLQK